MNAYKVTKKPWSAHPSVVDIFVVIAESIIEAAKKSGDDCVSIELIGEIQE